MAMDFAHISDVHLPPLPAVRAGEVFNKRILGFLSWHKKRKFHHRQEVITALQRDLSEQQPDHICITGDLTNLGLAQEFTAAATWLENLTQVDCISLVPGNHDAYVGAALRAMQQSLSPWMPRQYPYVHQRDGVAFIGVSTAVATLPGFASGRIGSEQLMELADLLEQSRQAGCYRIVLLHHPVADEIASARKRLTDAAQLRAVLQRYGAELVLHGHGHRPVQYQVPGPGGPIPVYGAGSASLGHPDGRRRGHYHLFNLDAGELTVAHRYYDPHAACFVPQDQQLSAA